jgi:hypothetical protein
MKTQDLIFVLGFCSIEAGAAVSSSTSVSSLGSQERDISGKKVLSSSVIKTSYDYTEPAFKVLTEISGTKGAVDREKAEEFSDLIVRGALLEGSNDMGDGSLYIQDLPDGESALKRARQSRSTLDISTLKEIIINHCLSLGRE